MKFSDVVLFAALVASLASGCSRRPKNITPLPATERVGGSAIELNPQGGPMDDGSGRTGVGIANPLPPRESPTGTETTPPVDNVPNTRPPGDSEQIGRNAWETWPQDVDTLKSDTVYFDFDKSVVKRGESTKVSAIADFLKKNPRHMVKLDGHADERGTEDYNRALGERRALGVREMLLNLGISADRVVTGTYGEDRPAELGHTEAAWSKNRRVEPVVLIPPGTTR